MYGAEIVNFGNTYNDDNTLPDLKVHYKANLIDAKEIDVRNLVSC